MRRDIYLFTLSSLIFAIVPLSLGAIELRSIAQEPAYIDSNESYVAIANVANTLLNISYKAKDWVPVSIPSGQYVKIPTDENNLVVSFHDGVQEQQTGLARGRAYALYYASDLSRWNIQPYEYVVPRRSFRSK